MIDAHRSAMQIFDAALKKYEEVKYRVDGARRVMRVLETNKEPSEKLKTIMEDEALWEFFIQLYPEVKDVKDAHVIIEKMKQARTAGLAG